MQSLGATPVGIYVRGRFFECERFGHDRLARHLICSYFSIRYEEETQYIDPLDFLVFRCGAYSVAFEDPEYYVVYLELNNKVEESLSKIKEHIGVVKLKEHPISFM